MKLKPETLIALVLVALAAAYRVLPHPDNVAPVAAAAIFAAAVLPPRAAFAVPLLAMIASDLWLGPHGLFWLTWSAFALTGLLGLWVKRRPNAARLALASVAGSTFYFVVTNLGVFFFEALYPKTWAGLIECFGMALPFYRNTLAGDLVFSFALFGVYALATARWKAQAAR